MIALAPLFVAIPLGAAFLCLLVKRILPRAHDWISLLAVTALLVLSVLSLIDGGESAYRMGGWGEQAIGGVPIATGIVLVLDGLSRVFLLAVAVVSAAVVVYGVRYLEIYTARPSFHALLNLLIAGMNGVVLAGDLFNLFVFLEIAGIASYSLVAYGTEAEEVEAAFKYLILGSVASTAVLLGIGVLYAATGVLNMANLAVAVAAGAVPPHAHFFASALFLMGFGLKAAMMPFHAWLPDAHPSAPAPISAMLSGLLIKTLGIYAIIRIFYSVLGVDARVQGLLLALGSISMLGGVLLALAQDDLKRLLAYHSVSQMGFVFVALGVNTWLGVAAAIFHALNHALFKSALFLSSGSLERLSGTRKLSEMGGLIRRAPATGLATIGAALSISGVPPFNGFWSKLLIIIALVGIGQYGVATIAAATAVMTLISFIKVQRKALFGSLPVRLQEVREVPALMAAPVLALALLCLLTGLLWPLGMDDLVGSAASAVKTASADPRAMVDYVRLVLAR